MKYTYWLQKSYNKGKYCLLDNFGAVRLQDSIENIYSYIINRDKKLQCSLGTRMEVNLSL